MGDEGTMRRDVGKIKLFEPDTKNNIGINRQVLLFCHKHPKMNFTAECIPLNNKEDTAILKEELQVLVTTKIISQQTSDTGVVLYRLSRPQQELARLIGNFTSVEQQPETR